MQTFKLYTDMVVVEMRVNSRLIAPDSVAVEVEEAQLDILARTMYIYV